MSKFIWKAQFNKPNNIKDIMKDVLQQKKIDLHTIKEYINFDVPIHSGFLLNNMREGIIELLKHKRLAIIGDKDGDGITASAIMYLGLKSLTDRFDWDIMCSIPERKDGYGLSKKFVDQAIAFNADCLITVDNGITALEAVDYANENNITVIVTDHHMPKDKLPQCIIIDPQCDDYPFKYICGALVAFKFIESLYQYLAIDIDSDLYDELLSFATIGTVADVMKLNDENRYYVGKGLQVLNNTKNIGLKALFNEAGLTNIMAETIAFQIGPMINAAGRLSTAKLAYDLLLSEDIIEAQKIAHQLVSLNQERRKLQKEATQNIPVEILKDNFIILHKPDISNGICGSIASSITDKYKKPCFVFSGHNRLVGSGRSAKGYSILKFIQSIPDIAQGGGHEAAAGISILEDNLELLRKLANEDFTKWLNDNEKDVKDYLYILCELDFKLINMRLVNNLEALAPFGNGNPRPVFMTQNVHILNREILGSEQNVLKLELVKDNQKFTAISFADTMNLFNDKMNEIDICYNLVLNEWNNNSNIQLQLVDLQQSIGDDF